MKRSKCIVLFCVFLISIFFDGCSPADENDISEILISNKDIHFDDGKLPVSPPWGIHIERRDLVEDTLSLIQGSDAVIAGKVKSVGSFVQSPWIYPGNDIDKTASWLMYSMSIVTRYEIEVTKSLKGSHQIGESVEISYPTDNKYISYSAYPNPDRVVESDKEYLFFLSCRENKITDEEHCVITVSPFDSIYPVNEKEIGYNGSKRSSWLEGYNMISLEKYITDNRLDEAKEKTAGQETEEFYGSPENYMSVISDTSCYVSEKQLVNTSDDIIIGEITSAEDFSGEITGFSGKPSQHSGKIINVKISDSIKGSHNSGETVEIFVREDEAKDKFLGGEYKKGSCGLFFLSCMDNISPYHLLNGELQASVIFYNDGVYNRAGFTEEARDIGFINLSGDDLDSPVYKILFSDCYTKEQIIEKIKISLVEIPNRITYGEYLTSIN